MLLTFFYIYLAIAFILIVVGLFRPEHTELSLIGFVFLFLCSLQILNQNLYYVSGSSIITDYSYNPAPDGCNCTQGTLYRSNAVKSDTYNQMPLDGTVSHLIGYYMALISILGFIFVIIGLKRGSW